jgi:hypothetical protein
MRAPVVYEFEVVTSRTGEIEPQTPTLGAAPALGACLLTPPHPLATLRAALRTGELEPRIDSNRHESEGSAESVMPTDCCRRVCSSIASPFVSNEW